MSIKLYKNELTAREFNLLRESVGLGSISEPQIELALKNGLYSIIAKDRNSVVGMGRLIGDGIMYWYIQDVIVKTEYQSQNIGKSIVENLVNYVYENSIPSTNVTIGLMAAKGKEEFYKRFGFIERPSGGHGSGMSKNINIKELKRRK